jgi:hypothetical protein
MEDYFAQCPFCGNGLLRPWTCATCSSVIALCDECELAWADPALIVGNAGTPADGAYPECVVCGGNLAEGRSASAVEIDRAGLRKFIEGQAD